MPLPMMTTAELLKDGPTRGTARLYAATVAGLLTEVQFMEMVQELVFQSLMGIEDMEAEEVSIDRLLHSPHLPSC